MNYIRRFFNHRKINKLENEKPFKQILINFQKHLELIVDEEIENLTINKIVVEDNPDRLFPKYKYLHNKDVGPVDSFEFTYKIHNDDCFGQGVILIKLIQDDFNYIILSIGYNPKHKFDMITYECILVYDSVVEDYNYRNNQLFDDIKDYLVENKLIGQVV